MDLLQLLKSYAGLENETIATSKVPLSQPESPAPNPPSASMNGIPPEWKEEFEEQTATLEHDGGLTRKQAETQVRIEMLHRIHELEQQRLYAKRR